MKLYSQEAGHEDVGQLSALVISCLARVEVASAIWRKQRIGELTAVNAAILTAAFEADYFGLEGEPPRFTVLALPSTILEEAALLVARHGLRAYDAVQLATAKTARDVDPDCDALACFDENLRQAAAIEGFSLSPPD